MDRHSRRDFLADVGKGMLVASVGSALAYDLGIASAADAEGRDVLSFGPMEPLVALMQETPVDKLVSVLVEKWKEGTDLRTLVAGAALANARTFGGHDYTGYHAFMALAPSYHMACELPEALRPLPVFKVLHRNTSRIQAQGGRKNEILHAVHAAPADAQDRRKVTGRLLPGDPQTPLQTAVRSCDMAGAEAVFASLVHGPIGEAYNHLQFDIQDEVDVHRVVLSWRAWETLEFTGRKHAHTLLRQSVRYCVNSEKYLTEHHRAPSPVRTLLPKLLDQYRLLGRELGKRKAEDGWVERLSRVVYGATSREQAADAVAAALAEGIAPEDVGEAVSLAANRLVLCDPGRRQPEGDKPKGSVHGASVGVHASDSANAWRNIARVSSERNAVASLIVGAFHTAGQNAGQHKDPYPQAGQLEQVRTTDRAALLRQTEAAIKDKDQARACALVARYGQLGYPERPVFDLLLRYATSEDGSLHAEKYYRTVCEEFAATRPAFRWRHLVGLARVTASEYGTPAPGYGEARRLLGV